MAAGQSPIHAAEQLWPAYLHQVTRSLQALPDTSVEDHAAWLHTSATDLISALNHPLERT